MRLSNRHPDACRRNPTTVTPNGFRQAHSAADGLAASDPGGGRVGPGGGRAEEEPRQEVIDVPLIETPRRTSYRSSIHHQVPQMATSCVVFLDKLLSIALPELVASRAAPHRSTLSVRVGPRRREAKECSGRAGAAAPGPGAGRGRGRGHRPGPLSERRGRRGEQTAPSYGVNSCTDDTDAHQRRATLGLLSFRGPSASNTKAGARKGNADEAAFHSQSNFKHRQHTFNIGPVDSCALSPQAGRDETEGGHGCSAVPQKVPTLDKSRYYPPQPKAKSPEENAKAFSLKEALELFRPDFISRSQGRVQMLEQRARRRRALQGSDPDLLRGHAEGRGGQKRNCTTPDPLSDNLFKPRERAISGREMQLRSRRIYNKLPEVTKKKEEEKRRAVSQTNRLRAEVFKKKLLDQILQR